MILNQDIVVTAARNFATIAHEGQIRKYTGEPYIVHPIAVAKIVASVTNNQDVIATALLHDVVEDTPTTIEDIERYFGGYIATWVENLTDLSKLEDGNRKTRKKIDFEHTRLALPAAQTVKLADLIDNSFSILKYDPDFSIVFMREMKRLLEVLIHGDKLLHARASKLVEDYYIERYKDR